MKNIVVIFTYYLLWTTYCFAQPVASPDVKCIAVDPFNGDVTLTWTVPAGPGGFVGYNIYSSPAAAGPYTQVGTVSTFSQTTFTDVGAGANLARKHYRVQTEYNPGSIVSAAKDTFSTIHLMVTNPGNGTAQLAWNKTSFQSISTSTGWYKIYREYPTGIWTLRDSTQNLSYIDEIDVCNSSNLIINYRIEADDNTGCTSVSRIHGASLFSDQTYPSVAPIDTVSVNTAVNPNRATISWTPSPSPDADSVVIYKGTTMAGPWFRIAAVKVPVTFYQYNLSSAETISENYCIAFKDSCGNISPLGTPHKTIYLATTFNICAATADLQWNKYVNWGPDANNQYDILKSVNGGAFSVIATNIASDTNYVDTGLVLGTSYCYVIRARNGIKTSSSNKTCFTPSVSSPPLFTYNRFATVLSDQSILIKVYVDPAQSVKYYRIQRATGTSNSFLLIATLPRTGSNALTHTDNNGVNAAANSYIYKVEAMDSCGHIIETSNFDTTILLTASIAPNLDITLSWNDYGDWRGNVDHYDIYRAVDGVWDPLPINTVPYTGSGGTYTDDIAQFLTSRGIFSYYVVAKEGSGNTFGFTDSSQSNIYNVYQYPKFYVPNAFTPNGDNLNDVFIPIIGFIEAGDYSFTIFDRTGTPVWSTNNFTEGWDGKKKGHACQAGVYMYLIKCKASNGDDSKISGTVSLFR